MIAILIAALTVLAWWAIGDLLVPRAAPHRAFVSIGVGCATGIAVLFTLYALHLVRQDILLVVGGLAGILAIARIAQRRAEIARVTSSCVDWLRARTRWQLLGIALFAGLSLLHLLGATAPPIDADGLGYHLLVPSLWNDAGGFVDIPWNLYAAWPMGADLWYGAGLLFGSTAYGRVLHALVGIIAVLVTIAVGRARFSENAGILAGVMLITTPMVGVLSGTSYVDLYTLLFGTLAFLLLAAWSERGDWRLALLAGILAGALAGSKIVGLAFAAAFGVYMLVLSWERKQWGGMAWFAGGGLVLSLPWIIKSWMVLGNPVWPFLYGTFGGAHWSAGAAEALARETASRASIIDVITVPFRITFDSAAMGEMGFLGAGYLAFAGVALWLLWTRQWGAQRRFVRHALVFAALQLIAFAFLVSESRYVIFILSALAVVAAGGVERAPVLRQTLLVFLLVTVLLNMPFTLAYNGKSLGVALGMEDPDAYLARNLDAYPAIHWANTHLPPDAIVYTSWEARTFYLEREQLWGAPNRQALVDPSVLPDAGALHARLRELGVTHYLTTPLAQVSMRRQGVTLEGEFVEQYCTVLWREGDGLVCKLT